MKTADMNFKRLSLSGIFILIICGALHSQSFTETRRIEKVFPVNTSTSLEVINKYGKIHVQTWEEDSAKIEINLTVKSDNLSKLNKIMNNIDFDFTSTDYYINAETEFGNKYNSFFENLKNLAETLIPSDEFVEIDYVVTVPSEIELKIRNKFGDVFIDDLAGDLRLDLSNGDLKANKLSGNTTINIEIGDGVINSIREGKLDIAYSDFEIKEAGNLHIFSRSSTIIIGSSSSTNINSRRDKYYLDEINVFTGEMYFSNLWVYNLSEESNLNMKYGSLNMEYINPGFSFLNLNSNYTDINLTFDSDASCMVDIIHENISLRYPEDLAVMEEKILDNDQKKMNTYGRIGRSESSSRVKVTAVKGNVSFFISKNR